VCVYGRLTVKRNGMFGRLKNDRFHPPMSHHTYICTDILIGYILSIVHFGIIYSGIKYKFVHFFQNRRVFLEQNDIKFDKT